MRLIVGLGNPGPRYRGTYHNVGFDVVDELARRNGVEFGTARAEALAAKVLGPEPFWLAKPLTFMNLSGRAVGDLMRYYRIEPADTLVIVDDVNLTGGRLRLRRGGSAGGHNGLKSVDSQIGADYLRVRAGVGHPRKEGQRGGTVGHVLGAFSGKDAEEAAFLVENCADAVEMLMTEGLEKTQMKFHALKPRA
jgi:peptidyl-tRNA hydrolase, PTH1 family